jgi:hypothetical protein
LRSFKILLAGLLLSPALAFASVNVLVNGTTYPIPQTNEKGWGTNVTNWIQAISLNSLQPNGGSFPLTADANFGTNFGLISPYYKSSTGNIATAGVLRLAKTDALAFRNNANSGNLSLSIDGSDNLLFNGSKLGLAQTLGTANQLFGTNAGATAFESKAATMTAAGTLAIPTGQVASMPDGTVSAPSLTFTSETNTGLYRIGASNLGIAVAGTNAINMNNIGSSLVNLGFGVAAYAGSNQSIIFNRTTNQANYVEYANNSTGTSAASLLETSVGGVAGIYTWLGTYTSAGAGYAPNLYLTQMGQIDTGSNMLGFNTNTEYSGASVTWTFGSASTANERMNLSSTILALKHGEKLTFDGATSGTVTIAPTAAAGTYSLLLPTTAGTAGQVLTTQGSAATMTWTSALVNPMTTTGDIIYSSDNSGTPARLAGTSGQVLTSNGAAAPAFKTLIAPTKTILTSGSNAVYTTPANARFLKVTLVGAGGGGGGVLGSTNAGGGGGGSSGGTAIKWYSPTAGQTFNYTVTNTGGAAGGAGANSGGNGSATLFDISGTQISASGGTGGGGATANSNVPVFNTGNVAGGNPTTGDINIKGQEGQQGFTLSASQAKGGTGGSTPWGGGGPGGQGTGAGTTGGGYGSGGGGGCAVSAGASQAGGAGAPGLIIVEEFY